MPSGTGDRISLVCHVLRMLPTKLKYNRLALDRVIQKVNMQSNSVLAIVTSSYSYDSDRPHRGCCTD